MGAVGIMTGMFDGSNRCKEIWVCGSRLDHFENYLAQRVDDFASILSVRRDLSITVCPNLIKFGG